MQAAAFHIPSSNVEGSLSPHGQHVHFPDDIDHLFIYYHVYVLL